jgi:hypothetical protein
MQVSIKIPDAGTPSKVLLLESKTGAKVQVTANNEVKSVDGSLFERAIANGLNVGSTPSALLLSVTKVFEVANGAFLSVENHPSDRSLVVVKLGGETRNVIGRDLITAIRHCADAS